MRRIGSAVAAVALTGLLAAPAHAVVGGDPADTADHPWMVALGSGELHPDRPSGQFCGATLVAPTKVVTAAHCVDDKRPDQITAIGGRPDIRTQDGTERRVTRIWNAPSEPPPPPPPGELPTLRGGDIAVLTLDAPMPYPTLPIATEADADVYRPGTPGRILGWGIYQEEGLLGPSPVLQQAQIPMLEFRACDEASRNHPALPTKLDPRHYVCGGYEQGGVAACGGDSGGPLVIDGRLAGVFGPILSRGGTVCEDAYSGYNRVATYAGEILAEVNT
ncbi:serine protease [Saccharopolyspora taberi]|uniref:Serine protease n=1 Tax=Saccharopolyspora taberi TaxID=60895 RepID=A0ABN3VJA6_9PSEU